MNKLIAALAAVLSVGLGSKLTAQNMPFPPVGFRLPPGWNGHLEHRFQFRALVDSTLQRRIALLPPGIVTTCPMPIAPVDTSVDRRMAVKVSDSTAVRMPVAKGSCINPLGPKPRKPE